MFLSKMRPNDAFGLVVFNNQAKTLIPLQRVSAINIEAVSAKLKEVHAGGGTTSINRLPVVPQRDEILPINSDIRAGQESLLRK